MLSIIDDISRHKKGQESRGYLWHEVSGEELKQHMPFWNDLDIQRISQRLRDLGIILLLSAPFEQSSQLKFAFNQEAMQQAGVRRANNHQASKKPSLAPQANQTGIERPQNSRAPQGGATLIPPNWQPDKETLMTLAQLNIPEHFSREQFPEFVHYWRQRGESQRSWGSKYVQHVKRQWTHHVAKTSKATPLPTNWQPSEELKQHIAKEGIPVTFVQKSLHSNATQTNWDMPFFSWLKKDWEKQDTPFIDKKKSLPMSENWQPDSHTINYLTTSQGIEKKFIEECIPEFIHKWIEKKAVYSEWGNIFAEHVIQQWRFVQAGVNRKPEPRIIDPQWQPSADCLEILVVQSEIDRRFIQSAISEFILYWSNRAQPLHSWAS